jgi:hypothetical protein
MAGQAESKSEQVNVRLTAAEHDVVTALAFLEGTSSAEVIRTAVAEFLSVQASDPDVVTLMRTRAERRAREDGTVASIRDRTRKTGE